MSRYDGNLSVCGQNSRLRVGALFLLGALILSIFVVDSSLSRYWRACLFLPFFLASWGLFQALYKT